MSKYNEIMDHVKVTEEMESRILKNVGEHFSENGESKKSNEEQDRRSKGTAGRKGFGHVEAIPRQVVIGLGLAAIVVVMVVMMQYRNIAMKSSSGGDEVQGVWNMQEYASSEELSDAAGFSVPEMEDEVYKATTYRMIDEDLAEVDYEVNDDQVSSVTAAGSPDGSEGNEEETEGFENDAAGNVAEAEAAEGETASVEDGIVFRKSEGNEDNSGVYVNYPDEKTVEISGCSVTLKGNDGKVFLALWTANGYSYSISSSNGLTEDEMSNIIDQIMNSER